MKKNLIVKNLNIFYTEHGTGPILLFLHGWGAEASSFNVLTEQFQENRCITLSFPGFGGSERPQSPWGIFEYAQFVRDFLAKLRIMPDAIVAHSFGGRVAIKGVGIGFLHPKKLVLIASAGVSQKSVQTRIIGNVAKFAKILIPSSFLREHLRRFAGSRDYRNAGAMRETFIKVINENLEKDAKKITVLTLLVWGEKDTETTLVEARTLHNCIPKSLLKVIPNAGHFVFQEQPSVVAGKIKKFL